jgi:hypothetical protein
LSDKLVPGVSPASAHLRRISVRELPKLAQALGVAAGELLGEAPQARRLALAHRLVAGAGNEVAATHRRALQPLEVEDVLVLRAAPTAAAPSPAGGRLIDYARQTFTERPRTRAEAQRQGRRLTERVREGCQPVHQLAAELVRTSDLPDSTAGATGSPPASV